MSTYAAILVLEYIFHYGKMLDYGREENEINHVRFGSWNYRHPLKIISFTRATVYAGRTKQAGGHCILPLGRQN